MTPKQLEEKLEAEEIFSCHQCRSDLKYEECIETFTAVSPYSDKILCPRCRVSVGHVRHL